jgi:hypothetical protein
MKKGDQAKSEWGKVGIPFTDLAGRGTRPAWTAIRARSRALVTRALQPPPLECPEPAVPQARRAGHRRRPPGPTAPSLENKQNRAILRGEVSEGDTCLVYEQTFTTPMIRSGVMATSSRRPARFEAPRAQA